jgi:hypothetical protein
VEPLRLKALYTVSDIARVTGLTRDRVMGLIYTTGIEVQVWGRSVYIPLSEIRRKLEPLWMEIHEVGRVLRGDVE